MASTAIWGQIVSFGGHLGCLTKGSKIDFQSNFTMDCFPLPGFGVQGSWNYGVGSYLGPIIRVGVPWGTLPRVPKFISNLILHWNGLFLPVFGNGGLLELRCRQVIGAQKSSLVSLAKGPKSIKTWIPMCDIPIFHHFPRILHLQMTCFFKGPFAQWKEQFRVAWEGIIRYLGPIRIHY